jgi:hypothetical protein
MTSAPSQGVAAVSGWRAFPRRLLGAALLRPAVYEDVEADPSATIQALVVVLASGVAAGVGVGPTGSGLGGTLTYIVAAIALWAVWSMVTLEIGMRLLPESQTRADLGQLLRTTGFASAPGLIRIAGVWPPITRAVFLIGMAWMLAAMILAVRQALDYTRLTRAIAVCVLGWLFAAGFAVLLGLWFAPRVY